MGLNDKGIEMKKQLVALTVLATLGVNSQAQAQGLDDLISSCFTAIGKDDGAAVLAADAIIEFGSIADLKDRADAIQCIKAVKGDQWNYSIALGRFLSPQQLADAKRQAEQQLEMSFAQDQLDKVVKNARDAFNAESQNLLAQETYSHCAELYEQKESEALMRPTCQKIFKEIKHPEMPDKTNYISAFIKEEYPKPTDVERAAIEKAGWGDSVKTHD